MKHKKVLEKLDELTDEDWLVCLEICRNHIKTKLYNRTKIGAHCSETLGMDAVDYYVGEAIEKIYTGVWEWKFEQFSITDQLIRVINSMISEQVRKYKKAKENNQTKIVSKEPDFHLFQEVVDIESSEEEIYKNQVDLIFAAIEGDDFLESIFLAIHDGNDYSEIVEKLGISKTKLYRAIESIKTKSKTMAAKTLGDDK